MTRHRYLYASLTLAIVLGGCSTISNMAGSSLYNQLGGMDSISSLSNGLLGSSVRDSRLSGLFGKADVSAVQPKLTDQLCSMLGGGCTAPLTEKQIAAGANRLTPVQTAALSDNLSSSLGHMDLSSTVRDAVAKAITPKLGGIMGSLL